MAKKYNGLNPNSAETFVELLQQRAADRPEFRAYTFLVDGETEESHFTYRELDRQARAIAAWLQRTQAPGQRALLIYPPGLEYIAAFFGCLYAGIIAVPAYLPRMNRLTSRLSAIVSDAEPKLVLTTKKTLTELTRRLAGIPELINLEWVATDDLEADVEDDWRQPDIGGSTLSFLQYTSGSTQAPKGVMVSHRNLLHNSEMIRQFFGNGPHSSGVIWLPPYHDMGLIGGLIQPMYADSSAIIMPPVSFIQRPYRWLQAISRYKATVSGGPNFAYDLCVERITPQQREKLDLSSWDVAFCGAEPIRHETLERFVKAFEPCGFRREALYPCYGLAEGTLIVTGVDRQKPPVTSTFNARVLEQHRVEPCAANDPEGRTLVGCGRASADQHVVIVNDQTGQPCDGSEVGEIWVCGPSVAGGYWRRDLAMDGTFGARLPDGSRPYLRTGDLGFMFEQELYVTGRIKDLIIIRGSNHYPQDIEGTVERAHDALATGGGAAFSIEEDAEEKLVVVQELEHRLYDDPANIFSAIRTAIADAHDLQVSAIVLLKPRRIPKTSSGKIQRRACRDAFLKGELSGVVATWRSDSQYIIVEESGIVSRTGAAPRRLPSTPSATSGAAPASVDRRAGRLKPSATQDDSAQADVDFFRLVLGAPQLADSGAVWDDADSLGEAQEAKFRRLAEMAGLAPGGRLLDIGCGWGGMAQVAVEKLEAAHVTGLTVDPAQHAFLSTQALPKRTYELAGWEEFTPVQPFDAIVCIDALEHFVPLQARAQGRHRHIYRRFFEKCHAISREGSLLGLQTIVAIRRADTARTQDDMAFLARMFPGSSLPYLDDVLSSARGLYEAVETRSSGEDYERTLLAWLGNLREHRDEIIAQYGPELYARYQRYFEVTLRSLATGYVDVLQLSLRRLAPAELGVAPAVEHSPAAESNESEQETAAAVASAPQSAEAIEGWLTVNLATRLKIDPRDFDPFQPFTTYGLDSVQMVGLVGDLEDYIGRSLSPTLAWDYPNVVALARYLAQDPVAGGEALTDERQVDLEPIAIVGLGCRLPGAPNLESYWKLMVERREGIREVPPDRWNADEFYDADQDAPGKMATRWGGFLENIDKFDPGFFNITPREAARMDPQQRLLLEVAWEALEHGGLAPDQVAGSKTGVFVGVGGTDYSQMYRSFDNYLEYIDAYCGTGNALSIAANRVSYIFDLRGPSLSVDTACSSALVALHYAVQSLRQRDCDMALAAGVNAILSPETTIAFSKARMLSPDGRCKPFDASANGYVRGEGCGVVVLKRLSDALKDGDNVLAVLRATAVNQDGKTSGMTAPNGPSQQDCIRRALHEASITPDRLTYIEAHGTGTPLGDPIEVSALQAVVGRRAAGQLPCYMGSVKANIGHLETASGVASLIKVVLMLQHGQIPPQRNFSELNPNIDGQAATLVIPTELTTWPSHPEGRFAGVSGFGFGGTNAHVVLEESPIRHQPPAGRADRPLHLAVLSAQSEEALKELAARHAEHLDQHEDLNVADICYSLATGRSHLSQRLVTAVESTAQLRERLARYAAEGEHAGLTVSAVRPGRRPKVALLFTGQGSQYAGMARELYLTQPTFRRRLQACDDILRPLLDRSLLQVLFDESDIASVDQTLYTQPALFAIEYALARLWESWGVRADAVVGHSVGEYPAACLAGVFSLEDGLKLIAQRARRMQELPQTGAMAAILASHDAVAAAIAPYGQAISIAAINGPASIVISGDDAAIEEVLERFDARGVPGQRLTVSHAFHSAHLDPMLDGFERFARGIDYKPPQLKLISNLTGQAMAEGELPDAAYWRRHSREPVHFARGMQALAELGCDVFLEVGPSPVLLGMGRRCLPESQALWLPSLRRGHGDWKTMLSALGALHQRGVRVHWRGFDRDYRRKRLALPTYPFQRKRFWMEADSRKQSPVARLAAGEGQHPLLGSRVPSALAQTQFISELSLRRNSFLKDHVVQGSVVLPGATYMELGLAAARAMFGPGNHAVENVSFQAAMFLSDEQPHPIQVVAAPEVGGRSAMQVFHLPPGSDEQRPTWVMHASGTLRRATENDAAPLEAPARMEEIAATLPEHLDQQETYRRLTARALEYGPAFRGIAQLWKGPGAAVAQLRVPENIKAGLDKYELHPALLDACFHVVGATVPEHWATAGSGQTYLPMGAESIRLLGKPAGELWCYARLEMQPDEVETAGRDELSGDALLLDEQQRTIAEIRGLKLRRVGRRAEQTADAAGEWTYRIDWQPADLADAASGNGHAKAAGSWLLLADHGGVAERLAARLRAEGHQCELVPASAVDLDNGQSLGRLLRERLPGDRPACRGILHLWALDAAATSQLDAQQLDTAQRLGPRSLMQLVQQVGNIHWAQQPRMWVVTRGAQSLQAAEAVNVAQATLWGMGRVAAVELPELACTLVDLDSTASIEEQATALDRELHADRTEQQVAWRGEHRYAPRLLQHKLTDAAAGAASSRLKAPRNQPYRLQFSSPGNLDRLHLAPFQRTAPGPGEVEIEVGATGLNFSDVLKAMGLYPGLSGGIVPMGIECAGRVAAVGQGVEEFQPGDAVVAITPFAFASHAVTHADAVVRKPERLSDEEAATVPITFLTAWYALAELSRVQPGERVLIHAGAGGVGLAAIQICKHLGAEVFATAGSEAKRDFLRSLGVKHVYNSRTLDFADEIRQATGNEGIDVVLNSLPGEAIPASLGLLRAYGRFCEIGKTDIYQNRMLGMYPFQDNLSFFAIDLDRMLRQRPKYVRQMFIDLMNRFAEGQFEPLPMTTFAMSEVVGAYRYMQARRNIGKVVVSVRQPSAGQVSGDEQGLIKSDASYLVTGGLGALGLEVSRWLVEQGARHLLLLGRSQPSAQAAEKIAAFERSGVSVQLVHADVADEAALRSALAAARRAAPPIAGVLHAAGVLDDGSLLQMDQARLERVMAPKVRGAWNLHCATLDEPIDLFVLFSSVACLFGSPGQGNYAAGNAFLDALAHHRRAAGLPAVSINWGPWAEVGMAARSADGARLAAGGVRPLPVEPALKALEQIAEAASTAQSELAQVGVMDVDWPQLCRQFPAGPPSLLRDLVGEQAAVKKDNRLRSTILAATADDRPALLETYFAEQLARVMELEQEKIDRQQPLSALGLDSLMVIELKNVIESTLDVSLPMARFLEGPSIQQLAGYALEALADGSTAPSASPASVVASEMPTDFPLSYGQRAMWLIYQLDRDATAYNIVDAVRMRGDLDIAAAKRALTALFERHPLLRTTFYERDGQPRQRVQQQWTLPLVEVDATQFSAEQLAARLSREAHTPFDLENGPVCRLLLLRTGEQEHVLMFLLHHMVADIWSLVVCTNEFSLLYKAYSSSPGAEPRLPPPSATYADFVHWQTQLVAGDDGQRSWQYWRDRLAGELPTLELPYDRPRPAVQTYRGAWEFESLGAEVSQSLRALSKQHGATLYMTLLAVWQVLLHRYTLSTDVITGTATAGRGRPEFATVVGDFVNPVAIRSDLAGDPTFTEFLEATRRQVLSTFDHQDFPFPLLVERLQPRRDPSRSPIFQVMFVMQRAQMMQEKGLTQFLSGAAEAKMTLVGLDLESIEIEQRDAQMDLTLQMAEAGSDIRADFQFNTDLFDAATIRRMADHLRQLAAGIVARPGAPISQLPMLTEAERRQLLGDWNETPGDGAPLAPLQTQLETQAAGTPEATAVVCGAESITYDELNRRVNRLAHHLRAVGVGPDVRVGICLHRSVDLVVAMWAVVKAGGAYVPLDPNYPMQRLDDIARGAGMSAAITHERHRQRLGDHCGQLVCLDSNAADIARQSDENPAPLAGGEHLMYVIYTSGSTGQPKGAAVYRHGFANLVRWMAGEYKLGPSDRDLVITSHGFDLTQKNFYAPLVTGGQLHLSTAEVYDPRVIAGEIAEGRITLVNCTPSNFYALVADADSRRYRQLTTLRWLLLGGEPIEMDKLAEWVRRPECHCTIYNTYGPTECTDVVAFHALKQPLSYVGRRVPVGRPVDGCRLYVLDERQQPVPAGVVGELCIGGICVGAGYINDAEMTRAKFLPDPFGHGTIYRTGDRCRWLADGTIDFLGRADDQVKVRGFRIELGEIETRLREHPAVRDCVVVARDDGAGGKRLVGYPVLREAQELTAADAPAVLAAFLQDRLPAHMVPSAWRVMDALPLTPHGKVDRRSLPAPEGDRERGANYAAPRDALETELAALWEEVLNVRPVGIHDDFFELGGHSLLAVQLAHRIEKQMGRELPLASLLRANTVASLAALLREREQLTKAWSPLVPIRSEGTRPPLFLVHPAGGNVLCYQQLAEQLGDDQPVFALQARGVEGNQPPHDTIEAMASDYLAAIRGVQPSGPYHLAAWSSGGIVAYQLAALLQREGQSVGSLLLLDGRTPALLEFDADDECEILVNLVGFYNRFFDEAVQVDYDELAAFDSPARLQLILDRVARSGGLAIEPEFVERFVEVAKANLRAIARCRLPASDLIVQLYRASEEPQAESLPDDLGWGELTPQVVIHQVPGDHVSMMTGANAQSLAEALRQCVGMAVASNGHHRQATGPRVPAGPGQPRAGGISPSSAQHD